MHQLQRLVLPLLAVLVAAAPGSAQVADAGPGLTIYNQNFAVVRDSIPLNLAAGVNHITFNDITAHAEADSVVLRDPASSSRLRVVEQNYRADPVTQQRLLALYEGKTIDFLVVRGDATTTVRGRIVRSGFSPAADQSQPVWYGQPNSNVNQPLIEVDGKLQFSLPGTPLFPALSDDSILKPTLDWSILSDKAGPVNAQLSYVTSGLNWVAAYNIQSGKGDKVDIVGWVTVENRSGKSFENARIKLMAGDVNRQTLAAERNAFAGGAMAGATMPAQTVEQKSFDEYHLYTLADPTTLRDEETKQIEFIRASDVTADTVYVYDGARMDPNRSYGYQAFNSDPLYGTLMNKKVWVMREIVNSRQNHLGMPIPKGTVRFYREDDDGNLEFTGQDTVDHTAQNETMRFFTGAASDLVGERVQTSFNVVYSNGNHADETFQIKVRNHKTTAVEIRVVEHLDRGATWTIPEHSDDFRQTDSRTIEFRVPLKPEEEHTLTYTAHYTW